MDHEDVVNLLRKRKGPDSWRSLAKKIGCSAVFLCDVVDGSRKPGPKILHFLGLKAKVTVEREYTRK